MRHGVRVIVYYTYICLYICACASMVGERGRGDEKEVSDGEKWMCDASMGTVYRAEWWRRLWMRILIFAYL